MGHQRNKAQWQKGVLVGPALSETVYWGFWTSRLALAVITGSKTRDEHVDVVFELTVVVQLTVAVLLTISWLYATLRPFFLREKALTVPYDLFSLYLSMLAVTGLDISAIIYKQYIAGSQGRPIGHGTALALVTHTVLILVLLGTILSLPVGIPPPGVDIEKIGITTTPEDYTSLAGWITFWWIYPIVKRVCAASYIL